MRKTKTQKKTQKKNEDQYFETRKKNLKNFSRTTQQIARNTASAAEFLADTVKAESRHFAFLAMQLVTEKLTGHVRRPNNDASLDPLGGVGHTSPSLGGPGRSASLSDDPLSR